MVVWKDEVRQRYYLLLKGGSVHHDFCLLNEHCFHRVGVGAMLVTLFFFFFLLRPWWTSRSSVVANLRICWNCSWWLCAPPLRRASLRLGRFAWLPFGFTAAPQIFGGIFLFRDPQKALKKNVLGPMRSGAWLFLAAPLGAGPIFAAFCELEIVYVLGPWGPWDFLFLGPSFLLTEWKIWFGGWAKRMRQG